MEETLTDIQKLAQDALQLGGTWSEADRLANLLETLGAIDELCQRELDKLANG